MDIRFKRLQMWGFRSFVHTVIWNIEGPPGLYFITGVNDSEPDLGGNGVGKSTLFEALYWCLFGKTSLGLRANNIITWHKSEAHVHVVFSVDGAEHKLTRHQSPNSLQLDDVDVTQEEVEKLLGLTPELALSTLFIGQFSDTFIELANTRRLEIFSDLLRMGRWEQYSQKASSTKASIDKDMEFLERSIALEKGRLQEVNLDHIKQMYENWEQEKANRIQALVSERAGTHSELLETQAAWAEAADDVEDFAKQIDALPESPTSEYDLLNKEYGQLTMKLSTLRDDEAKIQTRLGRLEHLGPICAECEQPVSPGHRDKHKSEYLSMLSECTKQQGQARGDLARLRMQIDALIKKRNQLQQQDDNLNRHLSEAANRELSLSLTIKSLDRRVAALDQQLVTTRAETNSYEQLYQEAQTKNASISKKLSNMYKDKIELESLRAAVGYWTTGFKKVRLMLLQSALAALEVSVNDGLVQLGMANWQILLEAERELATGELRREFVINVRSPRNPNLVPWEAWSGGERQRLRMAFLFGLSSMLADHCGVRMNVMFLDEPTTWLSEHGIADMLTFLKDKAEREGLQIWLADHRTLEFGGFSGILTVRKTPQQGSTLEEGAPHVAG